MVNFTQAHNQTGMSPLRKEQKLYGKFVEPADKKPKFFLFFLLILEKVLSRLFLCNVNYMQCT